MKESDDIRKIRFFLHTIRFALCPPRSVRDCVNDRYDVYKPYIKNLNDLHDSIRKTFELKLLLDTVDISDEDLLEIYLFECQKVIDSQHSITFQKKIVTRDNKGVRIGSGYTEGYSPIRYPRKNRSLKVWKNFYKMFPSCAEQDNFDGKTSDRMKK